MFNKRYIFLLSLIFIMAPVSAQAISLGTAETFNTFILGDFYCSSDTEGRLAVGGNAVLEHYSVGDKLQTGEYDNSLIVGGDLTMTGGRVYHGDILVGGTATVPPYQVTDGALIEGAALPIDFEAERAYLESLSRELAAEGANGLVTQQWGGLYLSGDGSSELQVFNLDGTDVLNAHTFEVSNIAADATVLFNISGTSAGLTDMSLNSLLSMRSHVLFNFFEAEILTLRGIAVEGSVLAPFAHVDNPQGVINGTIIAASWNGPMQQNHVPFDGGETIMPPTSPTPEPSSLVLSCLGGLFLLFRFGWFRRRTILHTILR